MKAKLYLNFSIAKVALFLSISLFFSFFVSCSQNSTSELVKIDILDVGKADCIVIQRDDSCVMIDTGEEENIAKICSYLDINGIQSIDTMILTHFDKDHIGGAPFLLDRYEVKEVILSSFISQSHQYSSLVAKLEEKGIQPLQLENDHHFFANDISFLILPPEQNSYAEKEDNNASLMVEMEYGKSRLLFAGDAMEARLEEFIKEDHGRYEFVKIPYHGNKLDNFDEFLESTKPSSAAITCSNKNPPNQKTIRLLEEHGVKIYETRNGPVSLLVHKDSLHITQ